ncbi:MAG TPA: universal stress protein [Woeseiaceae bacterium]|nr:universal stress protein [Woeseiaceae bacterium]
MKDADVILAVIEPGLIPQEVVARAAWLAERTGCKLNLLLVDADVTALATDFYVSSETRTLADNLRTAQREILDDLAAPARAANIDLALDVLDERPAGDAILARALDINPRFVVKGTEYHSDARRAIFVDTDWFLIRSCPYPLWLVKPHEMPAEPLIIAAVDPTHGEDKSASVDRLIVEQAQVIAAEVDGDVHLLHTYQALRGIGAEATKTFKPIRLPVEELSERIAREHREKLDALAASAGIDENHTHQLPGAARDVIPYFARDRKADLVVMGAVARWSGKRSAIGSTAERVLDHLPCDILIVRPDH